MSNKSLVYIVDDDNTLCKSIQWLVESIKIQATIFNNGFDFLAGFNPNAESACILLDIRMPEMSGLELQEQLNARKNTIPIIFMTGHGDIAMAVRAMKAGAFDFITKPFNDQILLDQIQKALSHYRQTTLTQNQTSQVEIRYKSLTQREKEVLKGVGQGKLNKTIAHELHISPKTVELHRARVMQKMEANSLAELLKFYLELEKELKEV